MVTHVLAIFNLRHENGDLEKGSGTGRSGTWMSGGSLAHSRLKSVEFHKTSLCGGKPLLPKEVQV